MTHFIAMVVGSIRFTSLVVVTLKHSVIVKSAGGGLNCSDLILLKLIKTVLIRALLENFCKIPGAAKIPTSLKIPVYTAFDKWKNSTLI